MSKAKNELNELVEAYNQNEAEQAQRLGRIFRLLKQGKGYRRVGFSNGDQWVNCWGGPDRLDKKAHVDRLTREIVEINPGD